MTKASIPGFSRSRKHISIVIHLIAHLNVTKMLHLISVMYIFGVHVPMMGKVLTYSIAIILITFLDHENLYLQPTYVAFVQWLQKI